MRDVGCPSGLRELGYDESDVGDLVSGAMKQQRLLAVAPMEVEPASSRRSWASRSTFGEPLVAAGPRGATRAMMWS